jgi:hypothetical protein
MTNETGERERERARETGSRFFWSMGPIKASMLADYS